MATLNDMKKYLGRRIEDQGGCISPDYKTFQTQYKNYLKQVATDVGGELVKFSPNHYEFSCFIKRNDKFVYISISDVRFFRDRWFTDILIRTAKNENDYTGGSNYRTTLPLIGDTIISLTR